MLQYASEVEARRMKNFIVLCLIVGITSAALDDELSQEQSECIKIAEEDSSSESSELTVDSPMCKKVFENMKSDYTNYVLSGLAREDDNECISIHLQNTQELYLKGLIRHVKGGKTKAEFKAITDNSTRMILTSIQLLCSTTLQEEYFNKTYAAAKESEPNPEALKCSQKYLIDKKVIDPADYNIDSSIETPADCSKMNKKIDETFTFGDEEDRESYSSLFGMKSSKGFECLVKKFNAGKTHLKYYALRVIVQSGWTQDENHLKEYQTNWQIASAKILLECMMEMSN